MLFERESFVPFVSLLFSFVLKGLGNTAFSIFAQSPYWEISQFSRYRKGTKMYFKGFGHTAFLILDIFLMYICDCYLISYTFSKHDDLNKRDINGYKRFSFKCRFETNSFELIGGIGFHTNKLYGKLSPL